jgi:cytoskeleton protein RodZ
MPKSRRTRDAFDRETQLSTPAEQVEAAEQWEGVAALPAAGRTQDGVGATLQAERVRLGIELAELAQHLKIRRVHLAAIEEERFDLLPVGGYAVSFVRAYAEALGLDPEELVRRYRTTMAGRATRVELVLPQPLRESRLPSGSLIAASIAVAALAYGAWMMLGQDRMAFPRVEAVPERLQAAAPPPPPPAAPVATQSAGIREAGEPAQPPETPRPAAVLPATQPAISIPPPPPPRAPAATGGGAPAATLAVPQAAIASSATVPVTAGAGGVGTGVRSVPPGPSPAPPVLPAATPMQGGDGGGRVVIAAQGDSWLLVRDTSGRDIFNRVLKSGESYVVPNRAGLSLTTGNAGVIEIRVDGKPIGSLGKVGTVRRDVPLDADLLPSWSGLAQQPTRSSPTQVPLRNGG